MKSKKLIKGLSFLLALALMTGVVINNSKIIIDDSLTESSSQTTAVFFTLFY